MRRIVLLIFLPFYLFAQNTIGLPDVVNYNKLNYNGGLQNWDIKQDKNGIMYFANNEGLLSYDGNFWNLFPLSNKTIVRSVAIAEDNRIYVGGQDELGYFSPNKSGVLIYHSLTQMIPSKHRSFGDVWDINFLNKEVFFRTANKIFQFSNKAVAVFSPTSEWSFMGIANNKLYAQDLKKGLMVFENNTWNLLPVKGNELPPNDPVTSVMPIAGDSMLITTLKNGLFRYEGATIHKIANNEALFKTQRIYAATNISSCRYALATTHNGVYIVDDKGNIIQTFSITEGLQNNNVLSVFVDNQKNIWLGLDNGIDLVVYNCSIKHINPGTKTGSGYSALIQDDKLYMGTSDGLFKVPLQKDKDISYSKGVFTEVENASGQIWNLSTINHEILVGAHDGAFVVKNNQALPISVNTGYWNFLPFGNTFPTAQIIAGNYKGLSIMKYDNGSLNSVANIPDFLESSRFVCIDGDDNIWVSHPYHGVYKITYNKQTGKEISSLYTVQNGLPSTLNNHVYKIKNEIVVATEKGIYQYNKAKNNFSPSPFYKNLIGTQGIRYLKEDVAGNVWFIKEKSLGVIDFTGAKPIITYLPELNNKILSGFESIYVLDEKNILLGGEKGFFHINYEKYKKNIPTITAQIRSVKITNKRDSLFFGGYFKEGIANNKEAVIPAIHYNWKNIRVEYSAPLYGYQPNLEYSYRLTGFEDQWSDWTKRTEKEYTNLSAGNYAFEVKARNNLGEESPSSVYKFSIMPPWYNTIWAYLCYLLCCALVIRYIIGYLREKMRKQREKYEAEQKRLLYIHELEMGKTENEIVQLKNEKLEAEINLKNSEIASSAMHVVKKGELLNKIKSEITHIIKSHDSTEAIAELKKMVKTLGDDDNMDKQWDDFSKHFDQVNNNFLIALKEKHPEITPSELKLSAYLHMNLSTKEIAQLMNISPRGVEISRYRLRKKLQLSGETRLFDYLISIQKK